jgi:hypothetical protein
MITIALCLAAAAVAFRCGYFFGRSDRNSGSGDDWRRSFNHENRNAPTGPPPLQFRRSEPPEQFPRMDEGLVQRGNGNGGPTTSKPQPAGGRLITRTPFNESITQRGTGNNPTTPKPEITPRGQWPGGYHPNPSRPGANPPPCEP